MREFSIEGPNPYCSFMLEHLAHSALGEQSFSLCQNHWTYEKSGDTEGFADPVGIKALLEVRSMYTSCHT